MKIDNIYNMDCLEGMKQIPDGTIDAVICDLPYGTTSCPWDSVIPIETLFAEYKRVLKPKGAIVLTCTQPFTSYLVMTFPKIYRHQWVWAKNRPTGFTLAKFQPLRCFEDIIVFGFDSPNYYPQGLKRVNIQCKNSTSNGGDSLRGNTEASKGKGSLRTAGASYVQEFTNYPQNIINFDYDEDSWHPTQKPVDLLRYLVLTYTNEGDTVLDNCMGSGTTAIACIKERRHFIGFELSKEYFDKAVRRIKAEQAQLTLF